MARYTDNVQPLSPSTLTSSGGIRAENKLMNHAVFNNDETILPDQIIDGEGLLKECIEHGAHVYTKDNVVQFFEWTTDKKKNVYMLANAWFGQQ